MKGRRFLFSDTYEIRLLPLPHSPDHDELFKQHFFSAARGHV